MRRPWTKCSEFLRTEETLVRCQSGELLFAAEAQGLGLSLRAASASAGRQGTFFRRDNEGLPEEVPEVSETWSFGEGEALVEGLVSRVLL